jgi:hypothetical protein
MPLLTPEQCARLQDWLTQNGELCADVYLPKSGGGGTQYFVRSVGNLETLISEQTSRELVVTVFRRLQYALRGVADETLLAQAFQKIPDGQWYSFVVLEDYCYPHRPSCWGSGNSHAEFRQEFSEVIGRRVGIGLNPFDYDDAWIRSSPDEAMVLCFQRVGDHYELERA